MTNIFIIANDFLSKHNIFVGLCTSVGKVHANIVLIGDPKQLDAVTKSDWSTKLGFKISWFEQLFKMPLYKPHDQTGEFNKTYITQLVNNYRSHPSILKVPNELFYENKLKAMVLPGMHIQKVLRILFQFVKSIYFLTLLEIIKVDVEGLLSKNFPIIFRSIQGIRRCPENETRFVEMKCI